MKRATIGMAILVFTLGLCVQAGMAGPLDDLVPRKIVPRVLEGARPGGPEFQFGDFSLTEGPAESLVWTATLKISRSIPANSYIVKTVFQNSSGGELFSGDDIELPAGNAGKTFHLTRPFRNDPDISRLVFHVYNTAEGKHVSSWGYEFVADDRDTRQEMAGDSLPAVFQAPGAAGAVTGQEHAAPDVSFEFDTVYSWKFRLKNNETFPVRISDMSSQAFYITGTNLKFAVKCEKNEIQPSGQTKCDITGGNPISCPTLAALRVEGRLNGIPGRWEFAFDAEIRNIRRVGVTLGRHKYDNVLGNGYGAARMIATGSYVRPGSSLTVMAWASLGGSGGFPVYFHATQDKDGIFGEVEVVGPHFNTTPESFCFNVMEIRTPEYLSCGGVSILLYRDDFRVDQPPYNQDGNYFLNQKLCR